MKHTDYIGIIPEQYTGEEIEVESSMELNDESGAKLFYEIAKARLLDVNNWHTISGIISAKFELIDASGNEVDRAAEKTDYFKIDIPGPGNSKGDGYDWVCVEELKEVHLENVQSVGLRVRPTPNPLGEKNEIAHFYSREGTSNFIITREGNKIISWVIDRNIKPNDHSETLIDKMRDTAVGMSAIGLFSKIQWQNLAEGLISQ